ncbi:BrnT family toxin [Comamonas badia]|uniref:BrnT family toxin n=1 Tax=Comamonas badia TaxID=265291 RepID=UPI0004092F70|nr:BrnT family toxin [Comamonas badia]
MRIEYDAAKDVANQQKHGVSLALAKEIDWPSVYSFVDDRADYGEVREVGYTRINARLYSVVFVQRGGVMRIISLRKANSREVKLYEKAIQAQ